MNWIEITPETELPKEDVLVAWISLAGNFHWEAGTLQRIGEQIKVTTKDGDVFGNPGHYCIVTPPNQ